MKYLALPRFATTVCTGCILLLAACSQQPARQTPAPSAKAQHHVKPISPSSVAPPARAPSRTGIPACDAYLSTYIACHRAAGIFTPGQLQDRYEMMRHSLLRDSRDPDIRPQLENRCESLSQSLHEALHGKSCDAPQPAPDRSSR